jgi:hypothetical protein
MSESNEKPQRPPRRSGFQKRHRKQFKPTEQQKQQEEPSETPTWTIVQTNKEISEPETNISPSEAKSLDRIFQFCRSTSSPCTTLKVLKHIYSIKTIRPFLYEVKSFINENPSTPSTFELPEVLNNIGGISQQKALEFLEESGLWSAYIVYLRYGDKSKGFSRQVKKAINEYVNGQSCSDSEEEKEDDEESEHYELVGTTIVPSKVTPKQSSKSTPSSEQAKPFKKSKKSKVKQSLYGHHVPIPLIWYPILSNYLADTLHSSYSQYPQLGCAH